VRAFVSSQVAASKEAKVDVKQAVALAKQHTLELFAEEQVANLGLEEVELDEKANEWVVTVGFSRPWDEPKNAVAALAAPKFPRRDYKVVRIANDNSDLVVSVRNREIQN
jgi:hypothetical protein